MAIQKSILTSVGSTDMIRPSKIGAGLPATIALKAEFFNPLGSVKDRIGIAMINAAEKDGMIGPSTQIVEPTSGNPGVALAFVSAARGYVDEVLTVSNEDAFLTSQLLAREERILAGISTGTNAWVALKVALRPENAGELLVAMGCSTRERYLCRFVVLLRKNRRSRLKSFLRARR